jgi:hypothetical protein
MKSLLAFIVIVSIACNSSSPKLSGTAAEKNVQHIVFGRYCGMCPSGCVKLFKVDPVSKRLYVDSSEKYFEDYGRTLTFPTTAAPKEQYAIAEEVISRIPDSLYLAKDEDRFGCPDCADGCGIYFEIRTAEYRKSFYIDYQTDQLEGYIKPFGEYLKKKLEDLGTR